MIRLRNHSYWEISRVVSERTKTVPLSSDIKLSGDDETKHERGVKNYRPWAVSKHNIGSNIGFINVMSGILAAAKDLLESKYLPIRVDVDPYMKMHRVM